MVEFLVGALKLLADIGSYVSFVISGIFLLYPIVFYSKVTEEEARTLATFSIAFLLFSIRLGLK